MLKLCNLCHQTLDHTAFCKNKASLDGFNSLCKSCVRKYRLDYTQRNKKDHALLDELDQLEQPDKIKYCIICQLPFALTKNNFYTAYERPDGFNNTCISCTKQRQKQPDRIYNFIKSQAKQRKLSFTITKDEHKTLTQNNCFYCDIKSDGWLDRKDPKLGYTLDNIVPSCRQCNRMKYNLHFFDFIAHCQKIAKNHPQKD